MEFDELTIRQYKRRELEYAGRWVFNWFSNFTAAGHPVTYRGYTTNRLEIAYVASKNPDAIVPSGIYPPDGSTTTFIQRIFSTPAAHTAKNLGRAKSKGGLIDARADWNHVNLASMDHFLRQRWQPGTAAFDRLLTLERPIVEANNWGDVLWGIQVGKWVGRNGLGLLLDVIVDEYLSTGKVDSGALEENWFSRQEELIVSLNKRP